MITEREGIMAFAHIVAFQDFAGSINAAREIPDNPHLVEWRDSLGKIPKEDQERLQRELDIEVARIRQSAITQHNEMARRLTGHRS